MSEIELKNQLETAIKRAEDAARFAENAIAKIKKSEKRIKKAKFKIKAAEKMIIAEQKISEEKATQLLKDVTKVAAKAAKKHRAIKRLGK